MRRILFLLLFCLLIKIKTWSQAVESRLDYQKTQQPVAIIELPCPEDVTNQAIKDYMAKKGAKVASFKNFIVFRSVKLDSIDTDLSDLYFLVDRKSRQQKDISIITLLSTKKNQDIFSRSLADSLKIEGSKSLLNHIAPYVETYYINVQANDQDAIVKKAQKKMNSLISDENDLNKRIRKLKAELDQNKRDQTSQAQQVQLSLQETFDDKKKAQKKMNQLMDDQGDIEKKLRKAQLNLDQNKKDQQNQQQEIDKQIQVLKAINEKQKSYSG